MGVRRRVEGGREVEGVVEVEGVMLWWDGERGTRWCFVGRVLETRWMDILLEFVSRDDDGVGVMVCLWTVVKSLMDRITVGLVSSVV